MFGLGLFIGLWYEIGVGSGGFEGWSGPSVRIKEQLGSFGGFSGVGGIGQLWRGPEMTPGWVSARVSLGQQSLVLPDPLFSHPGQKSVAGGLIRVFGRGDSDLGRVWVVSGLVISSLGGERLGFLEFLISRVRVSWTSLGLFRASLG